MAICLVLTAACRARPPVRRVASAVTAAGRCINSPYTHYPPRRTAAPISSSSWSRNSSARTTGGITAAASAAPSSAASPSVAAAAAASRSACAESPGSATAGTTSAAAAAAKGPEPGTSSESSSSGGSGGRGRGQEGGGHGGGRGPLTWTSVGLLGIVATLAVGYYKMMWEEKQNRTASEVTSTGKPALGGPFTLVNMHGKPVTEKDYHGSFVMLYFGFCHCPDICPSELVKVGKIASKLEGKLGAGVVKPVFVSVDPDRDSLAQLRHYSQDFHPSIEFLTGTKDQVAKAAKAFRVYFSKTEEHEEGEDYMLDHSIVIYLLAPNGDFLDFFTQRTTIADCVDRTMKNVKDFKA